MNSGIGSDYGQAPALFANPTNHSKRGTVPWSTLTSQGPRLILPIDVDDEDLSPYDRCLEESDGTLSFGTVGSSPDGVSPPSRKRRRATQRHDKTHKTRNPHQVQSKTLPTREQGFLKAPANIVASPASSAASGNSKGGRQEGYHLSEESRKSASQVRDQGSCFRCSVMREKVWTAHLYE